MDKRVTLTVKFIFVLFFVFAFDGERHFGKKRDLLVRMMKIIEVMKTLDTRLAVMTRAASRSELEKCVLNNWWL